MNCFYLYKWLVSVIISEERQRGRGKLCSQAGWQSGGDTFKPRGLAIWTEISKTPILHKLKHGMVGTAKKLDWMHLW